MRSRAHEGLMCPLEKGVRGIETSGSGYLRQQIRGGRKGSAHRQGLEQLHNKEKKSDRMVTRASSDAGPELAGREGHAAMESPKALIAPLERGCPLKKYVWMIREFNKSSSDDRPGPGICDSKYVEDAKAARSVRVWGSSITQRRSPTEVLPGHHQMPGRSWRAGKAPQRWKARRP